MLRLNFILVVSQLAFGKSCSGTVCKNVNYQDFPVISFHLKSSDSKFPLLPSDYLACYGDALLNRM